MDADKNYTVTEKKALAMVYALQKFHHYLLAIIFIFFTDHEVLRYILNKPIIKGHINHWLFLFQEFTFKIIIKLGNLNFIPDMLSQIDNGEKSKIDDDLLGAYLL